MARPPGIQHTDPRSRALVADTEPARVGSIVHALGEAGLEVITAYRGSTALARLSDETPDIVVVGDRLDDGPTVELIPRLLGRARVPILAVTARLDERSVVALLDAGADDVIDAAFRPLELVARVRALLRRRRDGPTTAASEPLPDGLRVDVGRREVMVHDQPVSLTPTEFELLAVIAARRGDVADHRTLLRAAWPGRLDVDPDLLRTHLTHLNGKLIAAGHPGLRNVRSTGYGLRVAGAGPLG